MHFPHLLLFFLSLRVATAIQVQVYHRVLSPSSSITQLFTPRGSIDLSPAGQATFAHLQSLEDDVRRLLAEAGEGKEREEALYQVALKSEDGSVISFSSVKACHALSGAGDVIALRTSPTSHEPYSLLYSLLSVPQDNSCPTKSAVANEILKDTTVVIRRPDWVPPLELRAPAQVDGEGQPVKAEPEKSFLQKYWMYLLPAVLVLLLAPGGDDARGAAK